MSLVNQERYLALREAGCSEDAARAAAAVGTFTPRRPPRPALPLRRGEEMLLVLAGLLLGVLLCNVVSLFH